MKVTVGRIVHYQLSQGDADAINSRRLDSQAFRRRTLGLDAAPEPGTAGRTGHVEHIGNSVTEGETYPAVVVRVFHPDSTTANLQVLLDGNDHYWATSRSKGESAGFWSWPPRSLPPIPQADPDPGEPALD